MHVPFGTYAGRPLVDLTEARVVWFKSEGFPVEKLGGMNFAGTRC